MAVPAHARASQEAGDRGVSAQLHGQQAHGCFVRPCSRAAPAAPQLREQPSTARRRWPWQPAPMPKWGPKWRCPSAPFCSKVHAVCTNLPSRNRLRPHPDLVTEGGHPPECHAPQVRAGPSGASDSQRPCRPTRPCAGCQGPGRTCGFKALVVLPAALLCGLARLRVSAARAKRSDGP